MLADRYMANTTSLLAKAKNDRISTLLAVFYISGNCGINDLNTPNNYMATGVNVEYILFSAQIIGF